MAELESSCNTLGSIDLLWGLYVSWHCAKSLHLHIQKILPNKYMWGFTNALCIAGTIGLYIYAVCLKYVAGWYIFTTIKLNLPQLK